MNCVRLARSYSDEVTCVGIERAMLAEYERDH